MSAIHEAIKRARQARQGGNAPSAPVPPAPDAGQHPRLDLTVTAARPAPAWLWWLMLLFVLGEGALYLRELNARLRAEEKMRTAYLQLNDARGETMENRRRAVEHASRTEELDRKLADALKAKLELEKSKRAVEFDNLDKEKKVSQLTKEKHEIEMGKYKLQSEIDALKAELSRRSVSEPPKQA